jgi:tRNA dimethylallyltransferase
MDFSHKKLIVIVGPTAVGKTALAIALAKHFQTEIVSADSRQIFRELSIGTAKPDEDELRAVPHHFINSHSIQEDYNAALYGEQALDLVYKLFESYDLIVVCGGSGLYIKALLEGFDDIPPIPSEIRDHLIEQHKKQGLPWLQEQLKEHDLDYFNAIDNQNPVRLMRALEVYLATGMSISQFHQSKKKELPFNVIKIGLELPRDILYQRIDQRMDQMIEQGLFDEAKLLYPHRQRNALQTVGYLEIFDYLDEKYDREEAIRLLKRNSRRYAKRQLTWFKRDEAITWYAPHQVTDILEYIDQFS